jgi:hypothetical protein
VSERPTLIYLEADDEVTTVVRRIREADGERVVLVVPGRSRATSSAVALRLLARVGEEAGVAIAVSGDALTRSLAAEAGLETYASVDDARNAVPATAPESAARRASIHVVRGTTADDTAPIQAVVTPAPEPIDDTTQVRPLPARTPTARRRRALPAAGILALLLALVVGGGVLGAVVLPAATIEVTPRTEPIGPVEYEIDLADAERVAGTAEATATVTATGTYTAQVAATGVVVLYNFNSFPVRVEQGTFVAAGEQAFATDVAIVVPAGSLTADGRILAGDEPVGVTAAAIGEAANVAAGAIDTVVNPGTAAMLRGFSNNSSRLVENPEPTAGGLDTTGPEINQADVDAAVAGLRDALAAQVAEALGSTAGLVWADAVAAPEPVIEGLDGLVGTRDQPAVEIGGSLAYDRLSVERATIIERAEEQLAADPSAMPPGHDLLPAATQVTIGAPRVEGDLLMVAVSVTGASAPRADPDGVLERVRGRSHAEAVAALGDLGEVSVELWPDWVTSVPQFDWRIDLRLHSVPNEPGPSASP